MASEMAERVPRAICKVRRRDSDPDSDDQVGIGPGPMREPTADMQTAANEKASVFYFKYMAAFDEALKE